MGQLLSSEEQFHQLKEALGAVIFDAMLEGAAVPDLRVVHPLLLTTQNERDVSKVQDHLQQVRFVYNTPLFPKVPKHTNT